MYLSDPPGYDPYDTCKFADHDDMSLQLSLKEGIRHLSKEDTPIAELAQGILRGMTARPGAGGIGLRLSRRSAGQSPVASLR
jgi:hypothetical protein